MQNANRENEVFSLSEVAEILGMPISRVKNWTIGRPLRIVPVAHAYGTGTRNFYRIVDVYRMAIAKQMSATGATPPAIQSVLDKLGSSFSSCDFAWLEGPAFGRNTEKITIHLIHQSNDKWREAICGGSEEHSACHQFVNVGAISKAIDSQVDRFLSKHRKHFSSIRDNRGIKELKAQALDDAGIQMRPTRKMRGFEN